MKTKDRDYFRQVLKEKRRDLIEVVQKTESYGREAASETEAMDIADKATSSYTKELMFSKSNSDRRFLQMIVDALDRLDKGAYGDCLNCEREIGRKRLEAVPWTQLCIDCQELEERGQLG